MFCSDRAAFTALVSAIREAGFVVRLRDIEDERLLVAETRDGATLFRAAAEVDGPVRLELYRAGVYYGAFVVVLQDDPSCLIVNHSGNGVCDAIFEHWFDLCDSEALS